MPRRMSAVRLLLLILLLLPLRATAQDPPPPDRALLTGAWMPDEVGLLLASGITPHTREGFDLRLLDAIGRRAGIGFVMRPLERAATPSALIAGTLDFAYPAVGPSRHPGQIVLSDAIRDRPDLLFIAHDHDRPVAAGRDALREVLARGWRVGIVRGEHFSPELEAILADPATRNQVSAVPRTDDNVERLIARRIDAFIAPRIEGLEAVAAVPIGAERIRPILDPLDVQTLHIAFSAAAVGHATIAEINAAIAALHADGTASYLRTRATAPILLRLAAAADWFTGIDILGTIAFALSGVLIARKEGFSLFGAFILAALPAVGGGLVRDLVVGRSPVGIVSTPVPLLLVLGTVVVSYVLFRLIDTGAAGGFAARAWDRARRGTAPYAPRNLFEFTDAIGLGAFTVLGVLIAVRAWAEPLWLWGPLCAALSGAGGGILRDLFRSQARHPALRTTFYAEIAVIWGLILVLVVQWLGREERPDLLRIAVLATVAGAAATRMAVVWKRVVSPRF